uniref:Metalloendopeptidase n=1 Tax=Strongyloides papillosus TaxID=174720 RepID=A0A0N5B4Y1_STREA
MNNSILSTKDNVSLLFETNDDNDWKKSNKSLNNLLYNKTMRTDVYNSLKTSLFVNKENNVTDNNYVAINSSDNKTMRTDVYNSLKTSLFVNKENNVTDNNYVAINSSDFQKTIKKRAIQSRKSHKWNFPIKYQINNNILRGAVASGLNFIMKETCIKFEEVDRVVGNGLIYQYGTVCASIVGRNPSGRPQEIYLSSNCINGPSVQHETFHALGLEHEMSRKDRDNYIKILRRNLHPSGYINFISEPFTKTYNLRYDYGSIMHYDRLSYGNGRALTIIPTNYHYLKTIGQNSEASFNDIKLLNLHYCNNSCFKKLNCLNYGYTHPKNCDECKCPTMYAGKFCQKIKRSSYNCPKQTLYAESWGQQLIVQGRKNCYFQILAQDDFRIKIHIESYNLHFQNVCQPNMGLEIKFLKDKSVSGVRFCEKGRNKIITSEKQLTLIQYVGYAPYHYVKIRYIQI